MKNNKNIIYYLIDKQLSDYNIISNWINNNHSIEFIEYQNIIW